MKLLSFLALAAPALATPLTDCLTSFSLTFTTSSQPSTFTPLVTPFNLRFQTSAASAVSVIAMAKTHHDVQACYKCAQQTSTKLSLKSGGHSYGAYGLSAPLVINLEGMQGVTVDGAGVATVDAGVRLGNMATKIFNAGGRGLPHGTCPGVGIGGHATLGGFGLDSRMWGLTIDTVTGYRVVYDGGKSLWATATENKDLFWALRGGGAGMVAVTQFKLQTKPAPSSNVYWQYSFNWGSNSAGAAQALNEIQLWGLKSAPKELGYGVLMFPGGTMNLRGVYYGSQSKVQPLLASLVAKLTTIYGKAPQSSIKNQGWIDSLTDLAGSSLTTPVSGYNEHGTFYAKSIVTKETTPLTLSALQKLMKYVFTTTAPSGSDWMIIFNLYGGPGSVINVPTVGSDAAGAYAHRDGGYVAQFYVSVAQPPFPNSIVGYVNNMVGSMGSEATGLPAYAPYADAQLTRAEAQTRYWGSNVDRLKIVKAKYDPKSIVYNPQGF